MAAETKSRAAKKLATGDLVTPERLKSMRTDVSGRNPGSVRNMRVRSVRLKDMVNYTARDNCVVPISLREIMLDSVACGYFQHFTIVNLSHENMTVS